MEWRRVSCFRRPLLTLFILVFFTIAALASALGIGYTETANLSGITITYNPIPLITVQGVVSLLNESVGSIPDTLTSGYPTVTVNAGSFGAKCLFNLERPTPNTKFFAGAGIGYLFISSTTKGEIDSSLDSEALAGFEWRPKEVPNLGIYAEMGYDLLIFGISENYTTPGQETNQFPNGILGQTYWGLGATWYF
jgi:hypothetical protein